LGSGSKVLFLGPSGDGMFSVIDKKVFVYKEMSFKHLGVVKDGESSLKLRSQKSGLVPLKTTGLKVKMGIPNWRLQLILQKVMS
jgi:hypothetical protein